LICSYRQSFSRSNSTVTVLAPLRETTFPACFRLRVARFYFSHWFPRAQIEASDTKSAASWLLHSHGGAESQPAEPRRQRFAFVILSAGMSADDSFPSVHATSEYPRNIGAHAPNYPDQASFSDCVVPVRDEKLNASVAHVHMYLLPQVRLRAQPLNASTITVTKANGKDSHLTVVI
jgi:hypothetical protein